MTAHSTYARLCRLFCNCSCVMTQRKHFEGCHGNAPNIIITSRIYVMKMVVKNISEMISHFKIQLNNDWRFWRHSKVFRACRIMCRKEISLRSLIFFVSSLTICSRNRKRLWISDKALKQALNAKTVLLTFLTFNKTAQLIRWCLNDRQKLSAIT